MLLSRHTKRREFMALLGGAGAWPLAARAQALSPIRPLICLLSPALGQHGKAEHGGVSLGFT
jgi:hypothetical protein